MYPEDAKRIVRVGRSLGVSGRRQKTSGLPRARATGARLPDVAERGCDLRGTGRREGTGARRGRCGPAPSRALRVRP